jgi:hypothetical protein
MTKIKTLLLLTFGCLTAVGFAQEIKTAEQFFEYGNYEDALEEYLLLLEATPGNVEYSYRIAVCYLNSNIDKSLALSYLQAVVTQPEFDKNTYYLLGRAYHYSYEFDKAIAAYELFKQGGDGTDENLADINKQIEYCQNAKELMKFPLDVSFENLGDGINTAYADYYPFVPVDESFVVFNSKRDDGAMLLENGQYISNIYMSKVINGKFGKATKVSDIINSNDGVEEIIGLTSGGEKALMYFDNIHGMGDLFIGDIVNGNFDKPKKLPKTVNSKFSEIAASINAAGDQIYFASDRPGGLGGTDIYVTRKLPNGKWGPPQNAGPVVNTAQDEDFPNLSPDGDALYFSSKGHTSMGGYDIFKASWDAGKRKWTGVRNLGYPINTPQDNTNFRVSASGKYGYVTALREGGYGDLDLYRVNFNTVDERQTVISGILKIGDSKANLDDIYISVMDLDTDQEYGSYLPNPKSMRYVIILPKGKFNLLVEIPGFEPWSEDFEILDKNSYRSHISKDIVLKK